MTRGTVDQGVPPRSTRSGARDAPDSGLPSDQSKHASTIGEQSHAIKLDTDIPIHGILHLLLLAGLPAHLCENVGWVRILID
jgi:hypothetical protein